MASEYAEIPDTALGRAFKTVSAIGQEHNATTDTTRSDMHSPAAHDIRNAQDAAAPLLERYEIDRDDFDGMARGLAVTMLAYGVTYHDAIASAVLTGVCVGVELERKRAR